MNARSWEQTGSSAAAVAWALVASWGTALAGPVNPSGVEDARLLLTRYAEQSYMQSGDIADLYSDSAWIRVRTNEGGAVRTFRGRTFKQGLREALGGHRGLPGPGSLVPAGDSARTSRTNPGMRLTSGSTSRPPEPCKAPPYPAAAALGPG